MSTPDIHANIARGWNRAPSGSLSGTAATGVSVAIWDYDKNELLEVHGTPDCHLVSVQLQPTGTIEIASGGRPTLRGPFPAYACDITQAGETSWARIQGPIKILQFYIPDSFLQYLIEAETRSGDSKAVELIDMRGVQDASITRISYETASEISLAQPFSRLKIDALAQELGIHLLRAHSSIAGTKVLDREQTRSGLAAWQIRQLTAYLEERLCDDISLDDLSRLVGLSSFHFCRAFKKAIGVPPYHWILTKRIERTKSLLTTTNRHVTDIALACGFSSSQHLSATFNKMTGMTPTQYRAVNKW